MEFNNVKLVGPANVYYDGRVSSRTFFEADGQRKTLGFVTAGDYVFSTSFVEYMEIFAGEFELKLPGETAFKKYTAGDTFTIPVGISFDVHTDSFADYCCTYLAE